MTIVADLGELSLIFDIEQDTGFAGEVSFVHTAKLTAALALGEQQPDFEHFVEINDGNTAFQHSSIREYRIVRQILLCLENHWRAVVNEPKRFFAVIHLVAQDERKGNSPNIQVMIRLSRLSRQEIVKAFYKKIPIEKFYAIFQVYLEDIGEIVTESTRPRFVDNLGNIYTKANDPNSSSTSTPSV